MHVNSDERAIRDLVSLWHQATVAGEIDTILPLMAEHAVFLVAGQPPIRGRHAFAHGLRGLIARHRIESSADIHEIVVSGDMAYCWSDLVVRVTPRNGGNVNVRKGSALSVLRRQPTGAWVVERDANMLVAAP